MPALQVRDCPEDLYEKLRTCAAEQDRSITQQTVHILREYLHENQTSKRKEHQQAQERAALRAERIEQAFATADTLPRVSEPEGFPNTEALVRAMRDELGSRPLAEPGDAQ